MTAELLATRQDETLVLTLSNPGARNALYPDMFAAGIEAVDSAERDPSIRAVVVTGADHFFCAGGDLHWLLGQRAKDAKAQTQAIELFGNWVASLKALSKPAIAAVDGAAAGGGFALALACDLIVAGDNARFMTAYAQIGLTPDGGSSWLLPRALPSQLALELLLEGKGVDATRLYQLGVVNRLVRPGTALETALEWARELSRLSPEVTRRVKRLVDQSSTLEFGAHLVVETDEFVTSLRHRDSQEGITAFLEKRAPRYK
ncbi:MAG: oxepin-CoA hydrolase, alternative type [Janthinobacterium lividum]